MSQAITLTKFQSIVERLMTEEELEEAFEGLKLKPNVRRFIMHQWERAFETLQDGETSEALLARGEGRLGLYLSWQEVREDLAVEMFGDNTGEGGLTAAQEKQLDAVFDRFFEE